MGSTSQKILLVEDAVDMQMIVRSALAQRYELVCCGTIGEAFKELGKQQFSLVLLDVELPDESGFQFCSRLRAHEKHKDIPVIFLTGRAMTADKVTGFSLGAEDYIVKPIDVIEFQARIDCKMRKFSKTSAAQENFVKGVFKVSLTQQKIFTVEGHVETELDLGGFDLKLLHYFLRQEGRVLSRDQILSEVWGQNLSVTDRTVDTHVYTLRQKLGAYATFIKAVPRIGYKFQQSKGSQIAELNRFNPAALDGLKMPTGAGAPGVDLILELTMALFETTPKRLAKLRSLVDQENYIDAALEAHSLKSSLRTMGADFAGQMCQQIEEDFRGTIEKPAATRRCNDLEIEYDKFTVELANFTNLKSPGKARAS